MKTSINSRGDEQRGVKAVPVADILRQIEDIKKNGISLAKYGGEEVHEGRCRELCAMYLREFILAEEMSQRLVDLFPSATGELSPAWRESVVSGLRGRADSAYCDYIRKMQTTDCLGWEAKVKAGAFGEAQLNAHGGARELLGRHRAFVIAEALVRDQADPSSVTDSESKT